MVKTSIGSRALRRLIVAVFLTSPLAAADPLPIRPEAGSDPAPETTPASRVVVIERPALVQRYFASPAVASAIDEGMLALTGASSLKEAWSQFVSPQDKVAIKINTLGGPAAGSHSSIINRVVEGLQMAGVPAGQIRVWDKDPDTMIAAGYVPMEPVSEWVCESVIRGRGWNPKSFYFHEVVGRLIYSDRDFVGAAEPATPDAAPDDALAPGDLKAQISNRSYYAHILTDADKIINIAPLSDHTKIGVYGAFSSLVLGSIDNHRRFLSPDRTSAQALAEIYSASGLKDKAVLHIIDGLVAQFAGGPEFSPNFAATPGLLMFSRDPVAVDTLGAERLEKWRKTKAVPPIADQALHLQAAAAWKLGTDRREHMEIVAISSPEK